MAQYDPTWSYGESKLFNSSGATVDNGDDIWIYGEDKLQHEYTAGGVTVPFGGLYGKALSGSLGGRGI